MPKNTVLKLVKNKHKDSKTQGHKGLKILFLVSSCLSGFLAKLFMLFFTHLQPLSRGKFKSFSPLGRGLRGGLKLKDQNKYYLAIKSLSTLVLYFILLCNIAFAADVNEPLINSEWVYYSLWKLDANGLLPTFFSNMRPYNREEIAHLISELKTKIDNGTIKPKPYELKLINKMANEFVDESRLKMRGSIFTGKYEKPSVNLWGSAFYQPTDYIELYEEVDIQRGREVIGSEGKSASMRLNPWKFDYTADFQRAFVRFHSRMFEALLGRQTLFWGPGYDGSLIISDNSPPLDMILLGGKFGPLKFVSFSAPLDKMWNEHGDPPYRYLANRYLAGHRIDWIVNSKLEAGLSEVILYGGEAEYMELYYLNPILPYYANQYNSDLDDNSLVSFDISLKPKKGYKTYFQFIVDDFNYESYDPNALGYIFGIYASDPFGIQKTDLRAEYTRVDSWTYTHLEAENQYTHYGWVIGHHLGPDADQILVELCRMLNVDSRIKISYAFNREGSRTVADRYRGEDYKKMDFPSGEVEIRHTIGLKFLWESLRGIQAEASFKSCFRGNDSIENEIRAGIGYLW